MTQSATISADYTLRPSELAATLALLVEARQPAMVWGPPGSAKSMIAQQVAADGGREYVDVRALLLDPVDLRGIPWRDAADRTRWAPPVFLPPTDDTGLWLINLEELPSCVPMVQAALYQLALERKVGEYELPDGASLIACGNREGGSTPISKPIAKSRPTSAEGNWRAASMRSSPRRPASSPWIGCWPASMPTEPNCSSSSTARRCRSTPTVRKTISAPWSPGENSPAAPVPRPARRPVIPSSV